MAEGLGFHDTEAHFQSAVAQGPAKVVLYDLLEDEGYYCVDNLPPRLLPQFSQDILDHPEYERFRGIAVCIDARAMGIDQSDQTEAIEQLLSASDKLIIFLDAQPHVLLKRFSETRRRHPLAGSNNSLPEAISKREKTHLEFIAAKADLLIDTTDLTPRGFARHVSSVASSIGERGLSILLGVIRLQAGCTRRMPISSSMPEHFPILTGAILRFVV